MTGVGMYAVVSVDRDGRMRLKLAASHDGPLSTAEQEAIAVGRKCVDAGSTDETVELLKELRALIPIKCICVDVEDAALVGEQQES